MKAAESAGCCASLQRRARAFRDRTDLMLQAIVYLRRKELPQGLPDGVHP
jgi:hypothetical protein